MKTLKLHRMLSAIVTALTLAVATGMTAVSAGCGGSEAASATCPATTDELTPVVAVAVPGDVLPVLGVDGKFHLVYELRLSNARAAQATMLKVEAVDAADPGRIVGSLEGTALLTSLRTLDSRSATQPMIESGSSRLLLLHWTFDTRAAVPGALTHRLRMLSGSLDPSDPAPVEQSYRAGPVAVGARAVPVLGPPLRGARWVANNGCCEPTSLHRNTALPVNGDIRFAQRFAIDYIRLNEQGRALVGSDDDVTHYTAYGADVLAVADGTVLAALDTLSEQVPPTLPLPSTITLANANGNHVVLDIGNGYYVFYAHLQRGATGVKVKVGDRVSRGQSIGTLGNTGNSSGPHLHFHVMDGPSVLGSNGLPYVIDSYRYSGQLSNAMIDVASPDADFSAALFAQPQERRQSLPLDLAVVDFAP